MIYFGIFKCLKLIIVSHCCIFETILDCSIERELAKAPLTSLRTEKVKECSNRREDDFYETLNVEKDLRYHTNCYNTYTSNNHIERYLKRKRRNQGEETIVKRSKRLSTELFDFKKHCLICGKLCDIEKDKKHPDRWEKNPAFLCRTADRGKNKLSFKDVLLKVCSFVISFYFNSMQNSLF